MGIAFRLSKRNTKKLGDGIIGKEVLARLHSMNIDLYARTTVFAPEKYTDHNGNVKVTWSNGKAVLPRVSPKEDEIRKIVSDVRDQLTEIEHRVEDAYADLMARKIKPSKTWLQDVIDGKDTEEHVNKILVDVLDDFINNELDVTEGTIRHFKVLENLITKYEETKGVVLTMDGVTKETIEDFANFLKEEKYIDKEGKEQTKIRSGNYIIDTLKRLRTFYRWANGFGKKSLATPITENDPFRHYNIGTAQYGTPFYLTVEERNKLYATEMPTERMTRQRDIFIFHCMIGCRIGDLWAMTKENVIDDAIEYIPRKTMEDRPIVVRVPLNKQAKEILERYKDCGDRLLPFVAQQQYNEDIKEMLKIAGITRMVTVLNPKTRMEEKHPIYEVATSHMARRTFIGNIYKKVKDPNLVGKLSGHKENSRAFARYRDIDEDMAKELVAMLE